MNDRIQQLAERAGTTQVVNVVDTGDGRMETQVVTEFDREWFALLIVGECVEICNQATLQNEDTLSKLGDDELAERLIIHGSIKQAEKLAAGIKQHFGVAE